MGRSLGVSLFWAFALSLGTGVPVARAADAGADGERLFQTGKYQEAAALARATLAQAEDIDLRALLVRSLLATGQREMATREAQALVERYPSGLEALMLARRAYRAAGDIERAAAALARARAVASAPGASIDGARELVAAGQAALLMGDEPKAVLATYYDEAVERDPRCKAAYLAAGQLSLDKHDDALAAEWFERGLARLGADADLHAGLARAHFQGDRQEMQAALDAALHLNPRHTDALLLTAEHQIDGEDYPAARRTLERALGVDPGEPSAWALHAVLAHLNNDRAGEERARRRALTPFARNPAVDALIGRKLSQKYRFSEGAAYQRRALALDPGHLPAKAQLAQDLLRLARDKGTDKEAWALAEEVHRADGYDVAAYNLVTLRGHLDRFATLARRGWVLRMDRHEADVYGDDVLALLDEASARVDKKYGWQRRAPVTVEIFPDQADFAVRTFGMPGGAGYLGVCFGSLITMNSPAGSGSAAISWRSVLWHEYTHVITLGLTGNKIPRWLSEGISVYEELAREPTWGQRMNGRYRQMILGGELTPVGKLSGAFLNPKTPEHVMFAYYQSALVVEFLVERHGMAALRAVLADLGAGRDINVALEARAAPLAELERAFAAFARKRAEGLAPRADFTALDQAALGAGGDKALSRFRAQHPDAVAGLLEEARRHVERGAWERARPLLERAIALYPDQTGADSPYLSLALVHRKLGRADDERRTLEQLAARAADAVPAYVRLIELAEAGAGVDAAALRRNGERLLAVNPMTEAGWRALGRAEEAAAATTPAAAARAVSAYERLLRLEPADQADTRYRLARLLRARDPRAARRHLLDALAEAPRLRAGLDLLLELPR